MAGVHSEKTLQNEIIRELQNRGWVVGEGSKTAGKYDQKRALYTEDVIACLSADRPDEFAKIKAMHNGGTEERILDRLAKVLEQRGTIDVLRKGFSDVNAKFDMCAFPPNSGLNPTELERSQRVILRVVPELEYSTQNANRIDLAFFVNGIPVATLELKTDNTQSVDDAIRQYRLDRNPKGEPLLTWKRGAVVHFAVSSSEAHMTTKLDGPKTHFLPFNRGYEGGAGNPPGEGINYLWEQILAREPWLDILKSFVCIERRKTKDERGQDQIKETLLFPRYHQWDAVTRLVSAAKSEGPGHRYLVQHSAGSGKSNSIMWLAHRLAHLYDEKDVKVFDTVFILTDRTVLDTQLAETVQQFEHQRGTIARIDDKGASKSEQLKKALDEKAPIVIVTLQTFPFVAEKIDEEPSWKGRSFAIIADEAHSSQTGNAAKRIREILGLSEADGDLGSDDELAATMATRAQHKNISYFAFTATPKAKTLELFGRKDADGRPAAFHVYTMRQAIEEEFILDVLENYTTYSMAYKLATAAGGDREVPKGEAAKLIARMVKLHSYTIAQKVAIIVEHFREAVAPLLNGHAKAMVVTDSREAAVRYKIQMDKYIKEKGYTDLQTLVAFSGTVKIDVEFPGEWTEDNMNRLKGRAIPEAFDGDEYQILIVAEKFQTGFDQPKLCAMYVDKRLDGIAAVQTLSRLNRTYHGPFGDKDRTYILDFVNEADGIKKAFQPYYEATMLEDATDPNRVHDLIHEIDQYGIPTIYTDSDIDEFAKAYFEEEKSKAARQTRLNNLIGPVRDRFLKRRDDAREANDTNEVEAGKAFRKRIQSFGRYYRFLSQLYNYGDTSIAKREVFYEYLARNIRETETGEQVDISDVKLERLKLKKTFEDKIKLEGKISAFIGGPSEDISYVTRLKAYVPLSEVIDLMNEFFGAETDEDDRVRYAWAAEIMNKVIEAPDIVAQALNNTEDKFALGDAPKKFESLLYDALYDIRDQHEADSKGLTRISTVMDDAKKRELLIAAFMRSAYRTVNDQPRDEQA